MKITDILAMPAFIGFYINRKVISKSMVDKFKRFLLSVDLEEVGYRLYRTSIDKNCMDFINFYFDKSGLDRYLNCKYEDELDIPKSVLRNETFIVHVGKNIYQISLLKQVYGELYLRIEN